MIHPSAHVDATAGSHDHDGFLVRRGNLLDKLVLARKQFERSISAFTFTGSVKAWSNDYSVYSRSQCFHLRRDQRLRTNYAQVCRDFTPSSFCVVIKFDLMRTLGERDRSFTDECIPLGPIVEHEFLVDVEPIAAVFPRTLHECEVRSGDARGKESGPANRDVALCTVAFAGRRVAHFFVVSHQRRLAT